MTLWLSLLVVAGLSLVLTGAMRRLALARSLMDFPNARSSHQIPTPRGGGVAIVCTFLGVLPVFGFLGLVSWTLIVALLGAGAGVALLGFLDDKGHVAVRWRLLGHFAAAAWALLWFEGLPPLSAFGILLDLGWIGHFLALIYLVWMLNLYNFMDGIDGIAGVEAITACLGGCLIYWLGGYRDLIWAPMLLAMSVLGFLYWNFPPARIFMGDAGSGFIGMMLGIFSLQGAWRDSNILWMWIILLGVFVVDSTFTLVRRFFQRAKLYEAHRSHAYQMASRRLGNHSVVTISVSLINILWLFPIALGVVLFGLDGMTGVTLAYVPLVLVALKFNAGKVEVS